jgi:raffinose/stachyose/melibiose transport system substrate-binding protein
MKKILVALCAAAVLTVGASAQAKVSLKVGDNLPDRTSGMGLVFDTINCEFKAANPGVDMTIESYPDQPWQEKVKIYVAAKQLPDINKYWSFPGMFKPLIDANLVQPLDKPAFDKLGYLPGALESNVYNGKMYGLPLTADCWVIYYNKKLFRDAGVEVPKTVEDMMASVAKFKAKGIIPAVTDGKDAWPLVETFDNLAERINGNFGRVDAALKRTAKFTDPDFVQAATLLQKMATSGLFADDLLVSDYGASRNLFGQGKAAMYFMGTWEVGLATDANFSQEFRDNVDAFKFPVLKGGKGKIDDLVAWYGGNIFVNATGKNKDLGVKYLDFLAKRWPALAWEKQAGYPAQKVVARATDTPLAKTLLAIGADAKSTSGTPSLDRSNAEFKDAIQKAVGELVASIITPEEFCKKVDAAAAKAAK